MPRLVLLEKEIRIIKGIIQHTNFNDQQITSIFSHLDRNINHREIGFIRKQTKPLYKNTVAAEKDEVFALLARYRKLQKVARRIGVSPSNEIEMKVDKSIEMMKAAVCIYNNPSFDLRTEIFIVNAVIAWTYLLHAYFIKSGITPVYTDKNGSAVLTTDGRSKFWDLSECLKSARSPLTSGEKKNLEYLLLIRHMIEHETTPEIDSTVQPKIQACAVNFSDFCDNHFGEMHSIKDDLDFSIQFARLSMLSKNTLHSSAKAPSVVEAVSKIIEDQMTEEEFNDPQYSFRVYVIPKTTNNLRNADQAVTYAPLGSAIEMAVKLVERPKFRATKIIDFVRDEGFKEFSMHQFIGMWKSNSWKDAKKTLAIEIGGQWFWYKSVVPLITDMAYPLDYGKSACCVRDGAAGRC